MLGIFKAVMAIVRRIIDLTNPVTVVNTAYLTNANARPQKLSNGWQVSAMLNNSGGSPLYLYVSKNNGSSWDKLCNINFNATAGFSMASYGTTIYILISSMPQIFFFKIDALTVTESTTISITKQLDELDVTGACFIAVNPTNGHLTAAWSGKKASHPNSFNIFSVKSVNEGLNWTKQDGTAGVDQLTSANGSVYHFYNPNVVYANGYAHILCEYSGASNERAIIEFTKAYATRSFTTSPTDTSWGNNKVYYLNSNYTQSSPFAVVDSNGVIHVVWRSSSATYSGTYNVAYSKSIDGGVTWSSIVYLTTNSNGAAVYVPTITVDKNNDIHVIWNRMPSSSMLMEYKKTSLGIWENISTLISIASPDLMNVSVCSNYKDFEMPMLVYMDVPANKVKFYGKWYE